jgi:hypothetical protein
MNGRSVNVFLVEAGDTKIDQIRVAEFEKSGI